MNKEIIENKLHTWFSQMTRKYSWLRIKFEFNEVRRVFMVSFSPVNQIEMSDKFNLDAMHFADEMNATYGDEAPLFTDEEALFRLSANAEVFEAVTFTSAGSPLASAATITVQAQGFTGSWASASGYTTARTGRNIRQTLPEVSYAIAA